ncbi:MAG: hypothetical protein KC506_00025 [Nanoarchaeota archaeon]|nr:hypothetical protein [Nanoarchaeota archaeon]
MTKKRGIAFIFILIILASLVTAAFSQEERTKINDCKADCRTDQRLEREFCKEEYNSCKTTCKEEYSECKENQIEILNSCKENCEINFSDRREKRSCTTECNRNFQKNSRELCNQGECRKECSNEYRECKTEIKEEFQSCSINCPYTALNENITCEDGKYEGGQKFLEGCEVCTCGFNSEVTCEKTDYCNFEEIEVEEESCVSSGGFFQALCRGPYFGIGCSQQEYCQCSGFNEYQCPIDHTCIKDFKEPRIKRTSIPGWRNLIGEDLGDIGICAKNPELPNCGNGFCENFLSPGSTIAETSVNCPADCLE